MKEGVPCTMQVHWSKEKGMTVVSRLPSRDDVAVLLHRLRPFILVKEPASFSRVMAILGKAVSDSQFRKLLRTVRERFDSRDMQRQLTICSNEVIVNSQRVFDDWLNSCEFHRDHDRRQSLDALLKRLPGDLLYGIVVNLLIDKANAVGDLAAVVALVLGKSRELSANIAV
jgi:hypothetical protein